MPLPPFATSGPRLGKAALLCALGSACAFVALSGQHGRPRHDDADADDPPATTMRASSATDPDTLRGAQASASGAAAAMSAPASTVAAPVRPAGPHAASAEVRSTFSDTMQRLGVDAPTASLLAHAFAGQIDFRRDLRRGDTISIVTAPPASGAEAPDAPLAVRIARGKTAHDLFLHRDLRGRPLYYTAQGATGVPSFSRYPLASRRVSSPFSPHRLDPVTHRWQSHDGVDFAAPSGTPVHATASGRVAFIGRETGYGRFILLDNRPPYRTAYAHLSRFAHGLHRGSRVQRGQVIGYVGMTGWATGPHLHYEVRVHAVPRNPLTVALPGGQPLHGAERRQFAQQADRLAPLL